jgi:hypothetical protein
MFWPILEKINCSSLEIEGYVMLGANPLTSTPQKVHDTVSAIVTEGKYIYAFGLEEFDVVASAASSPTHNETRGSEDHSSRDGGDVEKSRDGASTTSAKKEKRIVVYIYDVQASISSDSDSVVEPTRCVDPTRLTELLRVQEELWVTNGYRFPKGLCMVALLMFDGEPNAAARWLLDHGDSYRQAPVAPLVRRVELESQGSNSLTLHALAKALVYTTGHQLVVVIPPYSNPWNTSEEYHSFVFSLADGTLVFDRRGSVTTVAYNGCYDPTNNRIWNAFVSKHNNSIQAFCNWGPAFSSSSETNFPPMSCDHFLASIDTSGDSISPIDLATVLVAHTGRLLRIRCVICY